METLAQSTRMKNRERKEAEEKSRGATAAKVGKSTLDASAASPCYRCDKLPIGNAHKYRDATRYGWAAVRSAVIHWGWEGGE